jgi:hypothetical protein
MELIYNIIIVFVITALAARLAIGGDDDEGSK